MFNVKSTFDQFKLIALTAVIVLTALLASPLIHFAQHEGKILGALDFDPKVDGFGFKNYGNEKHDYRKDMGTEDMIRMFGFKAVCKSGTTAATCVPYASARQWLEQMLNAMDGGHCEGMAVACLRFHQGMPFKGRVMPTDFQSDAKLTHDLSLNQLLYNNIAYYWTTQTLTEPEEYRDAMMEKGPVYNVQTLIDGFNTGSDTYTLEIFNLKNGKFADGHAVTPFAVEDAGSNYNVLVYDNNDPGLTKVVTVEKGGRQTWKYITASNPNDAEENYIGDTSTKTFGVIPTKIREGKCFEAPFSDQDTTEMGCGKETPPKPKAVPTPKPDAPKPSVTPMPQPPKPKGKRVEMFLTGAGDMLVMDSKNRRLGYDPDLDKEFKEIPGGVLGYDFGGLGIEMPHYRLPFDPKGDPYVVVFSGADLKKKSVMDFVYVGPGFTVGFDGIKLDPGELMAAAISADGKKVAMEMTKDGEMPEVYYSIDTPQKSYSAQVKIKGLTTGSAVTPGPLTLVGAQAIMAGHTDMAGFLAAVKKHGETSGPSMNIDFKDANKLEIYDNIGGSNSYDVDLEQIGTTGKINKIQLKDIGKGDKGADHFEIEVGEWDGGPKIAVKHDAEGNGFDNDKEVMMENMPNDITDDPNKDDDGGLMSYLYSSLGW